MIYKTENEGAVEKSVGGGVILQSATVVMQFVVSWWPLLEKS